MTIEKAFAIKAEPQAIWDALWAELQGGDADAFSIESSQWPHGFSLRLQLAGLPVLLSYRLEPRDDHVEVSATLEPLSFRYKLYQLISFGHVGRNFEVMLVEGLVNLKQSVEPATPAAD